MTLEEFKDKHRDEATVTAEDIQPLLKISPDRLREYARKGELPFNSIPSGNRIKFLKNDVIRYCEGRKYTQGCKHAVELHFSGDTLEEALEKMKQFLQACRVANTV